MSFKNYVFILRKGQIKISLYPFKGYGKGNDQEVEFNEIKIRFFHEIKITIVRLKLDLIMRLNLFNNIDQEAETLIMRSKFQKSIIRNFNLMIDLLVTYKYDHEIKIRNKLYKFSKLHLWLIFSPNY